MTDQESSNSNTKKREGGLRTRGIVKASAPDRPLVSIVTVVFNGKDYLCQAIESVIEQPYNNIEYIIIDGGSTDGTLEIIYNFENRIDYWLSEEDEGIYDAMNKGINLASGELIGLLNADDYYVSDAINSIVRTYLINRSACILCGNTYVIQADLDIVYRSFVNNEYWKGICCNHQAMFIHRDVYERIGMYDLKYKIAADYDLFLRARKNNVALVTVDRFIVYFRNTGSSFTNLIDALNEKKIINRNYFGVMSLNHLKYLLVYIRSIVLIMLQKIIHILFGDRVLMRARALYTRLFISKDQEI